MKKLLFLLFSFSFLVSYAQTNAPVLNNQRDTLSWVLGESHARACLDNNMGLDLDIAVEAFLYTLQRSEPVLDEKSYQMALDYINYVHMMSKRRNDAEQAEKSARLEATFLQDLAAKNSQMKQSPQGFYYEVLQEGSGPTAQPNQRVTFDYRGYNMLTGELLDQTYGTSGSITICLNETVFKGLWMGMQMMRSGSIYRFYFPNALVFGSKGANVIPPFTAMIYEVELHQVHQD